MNNELNGVLVVNKPANYTSRDVVNKVSKILNTKKIGHTGTLDPLATGVLVLTIGKYTKLSNYLTCTYKTYRAEMLLGYETDTLDITGTTTKKSNASFSEKEIKKSILSFNNLTYNQEVPKYSAVKINGKKLYDYARNNIDINLPSRLVHIKKITDIDITNNVVKFTCEVSKGTYIRSLIRDMGNKLSTYATMKSLTRIKQGVFSIENAYTMEDIEKGNYRFVHLEDVLNIKEIILDDTNVKNIENGKHQKIKIDEDYICFSYQNKKIALYKRASEDEFKMFIKF